MVRNEATMLPRWIAHYSRQCSGPESLVIVDDHTTDGSTDGLPCPVIRIPPFIHRPFEPARLAVVSHLASALLEAYDAVAFTDADEFLVADPDKYGTLRDLVAAKPASRVFGAMGLNVIHQVHDEPPLDPAQPILSQRRLAKFLPLMCKPAVKRVHNPWTAASHGLRNMSWSIDPDLYMFHAKFADRDALRETAEQRREAVEKERRPMRTSWRFGSQSMVSLLEETTRRVPAADQLPVFEPSAELLEGIVQKAKDDVFRARGKRQVPAMRDGHYVLVPERFRGLL